MPDKKFWTWQLWLLTEFRPPKMRNGLIVWSLRFAKDGTDGKQLYKSAEAIKTESGYSVTTITQWRAACVKAGSLTPTGKRRNGQRELTIAIDHLPLHEEFRQASDQATSDIANSPIR